jgi:hypothetical protein
VDLGAEAGSSARRAQGFRKELFSRTPFQTNPHSEGFAGEVRPGTEMRNGRSKRNWPVNETERQFGSRARRPHRNSTPDGKPTESIDRHGREGSGGNCEAMGFEGSMPALTADHLVAEKTSGPCNWNARIVF